MLRVILSRQETKNAQAVKMLLNNNVKFGKQASQIGGKELGFANVVAGWVNCKILAARKVDACQIGVGKNSVPEVAIMEF